MSRRFSIALASIVACCALFPALSQASTASRSGGTFEITGGGFGHGIGMSQYGAMGYALHGWHYNAILGHYYQGTSLGRVSNATVTVLLNSGAATFKGATSANGMKLSATKSYGVLVAGSKLTLLSGGRKAGSFTAPLKVNGGELTVAGKGRYAGSLEFYASGSGGVLTVNAVPLEDYVRGVIAEEMPASWPLQALEAQAVAARTYVLADTPVSSEYDVYSDTRSQMYGGISAETPASDTATSATTGQVVESGGRVIPTYFFSSSGGHTESIQDVWVGTSPAAYLTGVPDPYDDSGGNPYYRWSDKLSLASAASRLTQYYKGTFEGIKVLTHGTSPRVVSAAVIGTKGRSTVSGEALQEDLGTDSTWMSFITVTAKGTSSSGSGTSTAAGAAPSGTASSRAATGTSPAATSADTGGAGIGSDLARVPSRIVSGTIFPAVRGAVVTVQQRVGAGWIRAGTTHVRRDGSYALYVMSPGVYRALYRGVPAPTVTLR